MAAMMKANFEFVPCATASPRLSCGRMNWERVHQAMGARCTGGGSLQGDGGGIVWVMGGGFVAGLGGAVTLGAGVGTTLAAGGGTRHGVVSVVGDVCVLVEVWLVVWLGWWSIWQRDFDCRNGLELGV